ncbi:uncharacterized protein LOC110867246 [Helianthus annuus]|uniref:uncharacterized protein LOC110867246 n=1 Tax=Helianthus annuus TaxID=4232 RepID=UPI000B8F10DE|nr:uncharacterized protein LOC110867246 [Helianthus annuus]
MRVSLVRRLSKQSDHTAYKKYALFSPFSSCAPSLFKKPSTFLLPPASLLLRGSAFGLPPPAPPSSALSVALSASTESGQKDASVTDGYNGWNKKDRLGIHVGKLNSFHNKALQRCDDFRKPKQSISSAFQKHGQPSQKHKIEYRIRLSTSVILAKALLNGALLFRGHDESESSIYKGHFLEFLKLLGELNESIGKVILGNAPGNNQMTSPKIQKDIFDESRDISKIEQMAVILRYVDKHEVIKERFTALVHVMETSALSLKSGLEVKNTMVLAIWLMIREKQKEKVQEAIGREGVETGSGLNQKLSTARAGYTRWSSHHKTLVRLVQLYPTIFEVLQYIRNSGFNNVHQRQANALQRKDQDIVNAIQMVTATKQQLQTYRLEGFDSLLKDVASFCEKNEIEIFDMEDEYVNPKYKRKMTNITNHHYYEVENFDTVLDMQLQELDNRFSEILRLAEFYLFDFSYEERESLMIELGNYIIIMRKDGMFANVNEIYNLAKRMVETKKHLRYTLVYRLLKLALILPVATARVERCFSSMKHVKTDLRNRMGDDYMNDCCICYIERDLLANVSVDDVIDHF